MMEAVAARMLSLVEGTPTTNVIEFNNMQR